ncbi:UNVERIFIED_CONTAM: transporter, major facilitator family protein [Hammondia hammondi]|eukprot:XP_008881977.1 transporter, major facilitator family protein [Hammondia hammondi]
MVNMSLQKEGRQRSLRDQRRSTEETTDDFNIQGLDSRPEKLSSKGLTARRMKQLPWSYLLSYAAPMIGAGGMNFTLTTFAAYFYTDVMGVSAGTVGKIQMCLMIMYAASEPLFGWASDITGGWVQMKLGRRKPYLAVSALLHAITFMCLMGPPATLTSENGLVEWAFCFAILLGVSWGCNEVTYQALGAQLTFDYDERTKLQAIAVSVVTVGSTSCGLLHGILGSALGSSFEAVRFRFTVLACVYGGLFVVGTLIMLIVIKEETVQMDYSGVIESQTFGEWIMMGVDSAKQMFLNLPFFLLIVCYSCTIMAGAVTPMMLPYFCKHVTQSAFATDWAPLLFTASAVAGMPLWVFLGSSYVGMEKKWRFLLAGYWLALFLGLSALFVKPGENDLFITLSVLGGLAMGGYFATPEAMKPDVVDYDEFKTGARHEARFAGVFMFFANIMAGVALEVMLLLLEHFGYDGTKKMGEAEPEAVIMTIRVGYGAALALMLIFITPSMILYPITRKSHEDILTAIQRRMDGEFVADPLYGGAPLPPYDNVPINRRMESADAGDQQTMSRGSSFLQQVGMEVGSLASSHGDRSGIRYVP